MVEREKEVEIIYVGVSPAAMWFAGVRRISFLFVVGLLVISVLFVWVCSHSCRVEAIPISSSPSSSSTVPTKEKLSYGVLDNKSKQDLVHKYLSGRRASAPPAIKTTPNGFEESKRRIPSCPDPLHN
ncbi:CLAVATA3/ESR (CLE)-related protein 43-like [Prosopis cineraria]|uniref:CLAVATA3/ESR (CLE)-related protein 43-like n=1 Tax=Prosopis cineraria TaxID=364024 RepID=UPI002410ACA7|nr:CLAVATA3/ESR (CLE)-related protein 43-like [Prosopis cineraria]